MRIAGITGDLVQSQLMGIGALLEERMNRQCNPLSEFCCHREEKYREKSDLKLRK